MFEETLLAKMYLLLLLAGAIRLENHCALALFTKFNQPTEKFETLILNRKLNTVHGSFRNRVLFFSFFTNVTVCSVDMLS